MVYPSNGIHVECRISASMTFLRVRIAVESVESEDFGTFTIFTNALNCKELENLKKIKLLYLVVVVGLPDSFLGMGGVNQLCGVPVIGRLPTDGTRGPEMIGYGRIWPDADGPVQGSLARDVKGRVIQNHSYCIKESRLDQPCGDKS